jgi:PAS fold.
MSSGYLASSHAAARHAAFLHAPMGMAVTTVDGVLVEVNLALGTLLGRTPEALRGTSLFDLTHPDDREGARRSCAGLRVHRSPSGGTSAGSCAWTAGPSRCRSRRRGSTPTAGSRRTW